MKRQGLGRKITEAIGVVLVLILGAGTLIADPYEWVSVNKSAPWTSRYFFGLVGNTNVVSNKIWLMAGWGNSGAKNDVWSSSDGTSWTLVTTSTPWSDRGGQSAVVFNNKLWLMAGSDSSGPKNDVWSSSDGTSWTLVATSAPWSARVVQSAVVFNNKLWLMAGQDSSGPKNDVWSSSDGTSWTLVAKSAPWTARIYQSVVVFNNKLWLIAGSDSSGPKNDVWSSSDGTSWTLVAKSVPWSPRYGQSAVVFNNKLWLMAGQDSSDNKRNDIWFSLDGVNWTQLPSVPWSGRVGQSVIVFKGQIVMAGGAIQGGFFNDVWRYELKAPAMAPEPVVTRGTSNTVSWALTGAEGGYIVQCSEDFSFSPLLVSVQVSSATSSYTFTGLRDGVTYWYRVQALDAESQSDWSQPVFSRQDNTGPSVANVKVSSLLAIDVVFSEPMGYSALLPANYTTSGSGKGAFSSSPDKAELVAGATYRLTWNSGEMCDGGDITISVVNVADVVGNLIVSPNIGTDVGGGKGTKPTFTISSPAQDPANGTSIPVSVVFSEPITGFVSDDLVLTNASVVGFIGSGTSYSFNLVPQVQGMFGALIPADVATDLAGNSNSASGILTRVWDSVAPSEPSKPQGPGSFSLIPTIDFVWGSVEERLKTGERRFGPNPITYDVEVGTAPDKKDVLGVNIGLTKVTVTGTIGAILHCRVRARDKAGNVSQWVHSDGVYLVIPLPIPSVAIDPEPPRTIDSPSANVNVADPNIGGAIVERKTRWLVNDVFVSSETVLPAKLAKKNQKITAYAKVRNSYGAWSEWGRTDAFVRICPPGQPRVTIISKNYPQNPLPRETLGTSITVADNWRTPDGDLYTVAFMWYKSLDKGASWLYQGQFWNSPTIDGIYINKDDLWKVNLVPYIITTSTVSLPDNFTTVSVTASEIAPALAAGPGPVKLADFIMLVGPSGTDQVSVTGNQRPVCGLNSLTAVETADRRIKITASGTVSDPDNDWSWARLYWTDGYSTPALIIKGMPGPVWSFVQTVRIPLYCPVKLQLLAIDAKGAVSDQISTPLVVQRFTTVRRWTSYR